MYQRILVPVDGSPTSLQGLAEAIRLAQTTGGQIRVLHMVDTLSIAMAVGAYAISADVLDQLRADGEQILQDARAQAVAAGVAADTVLDDGVHGHLADRVAEQVRTWPADVVVLGTHGRRGVGRLLLGSDAEQVLRTTRVPVLLVRGQEAP
ncbi:universal stress protein [Comamonas granuli]|uniref:universal stress protein n=1 Tax=Comamonas granuli TaxID=290309 RepID=UPI0005A633A4|nr:universal stress protein [Comamonas granuli]